MKTKFFLILIMLAISAQSQDTLRVVQYNLLYYGLDDQGCNSSNNSVSAKTNYLKTIVSYLKPDIFAVNEITSLENYHDYLLANVFLNNINCYGRGSTKGNYLTNQIFYNKCKLTLVKEFDIYGYPRDTYVYKFYYNSPDLANGADTVYLWYLVSHLKAGNDTEDENYRASAAINIMNFVEEKNPTNLILSGDFNLYSSTEEAYQEFINNNNSSINLTDPGPAGNWHDNENFALYHTQSTHYNSNGCAAGYGLNDRFDFILFSKGIENNTNKIKYIDGSFKVVGQDGNHFNDGVDYNGNNSVPSEVLNALANNSDHLPVYAEFFVSQTPAPTEIKNIKKQEQIIYSNPVKNNLLLTINDNTLMQNDELYFYFYNTAGQKVYFLRKKINPYDINYKIRIEKLPSGFYFVEIKGNNKGCTSIKIIKE